MVYTWLVCQFFSRRNYFRLRICCHIMMHNGLPWWIYSDETLPTTFACSFPTHWSNFSLMCISIIQNCLSEVCFVVLGKGYEQIIKQRAIWTIEMSHLTPLTPSPSLVFSLPRFILMGSPCATTCARPPPHLFHSSVPLTLSPSALCVSPVNSFLKNGVSSGFTLVASRGICGNEPVHGAR